MEDVLHKKFQNKRAISSSSSQTSPGNIVAVPDNAWQVILRFISAAEIADVGCLAMSSKAIRSQIAPLVPGNILPPPGAKQARVTSLAVVSYGRYGKRVYSHSAVCGTQAKRIQLACNVKEEIE